MSSPDMSVVVGDPPVKGAPPSKLPAWLQSPRNKTLAGLGLLALIAVPAIVAPVVVTQQQKQQRENAIQSSDPGSPEAMSRRGATQNADDPDDFVMVARNGSSKPRTRKFDATGLDSGVNSTRRVKVPTRSWAKANRTRASLTRPENWSPFVKIRDGQFDDNCRPFYPVGFNAFELTTMAATGRKDDVDAVFKQAASMGMTAARTWAHSISQKFPFQTAPGKYDEAGLEALDYVIASASKHGVKLILSFIDNWKYYNGVDQFVDWCIPERKMPPPKESGGDTDTDTMTDAQKRYETERHALFFKEEPCKQLYKDHVDFIVNRVNSVTGKKYKNDPTILAWNLINEPRCETWVDANSWCYDALASWFKEMAGHVKASDPNHLVTSGSEGFFGPNSPNVGSNPQPWAKQTGQNFVDDNRHMDFAVTHAWPDNWFIPNENQGSFLRSWLDSHLSAAETIGKPLLFEEFGKKLDGGAPAGDITKLRDPVYEASFQAVESAIESDRPLLGSLYWKWAVPGVEKGPYGVDLEDSTMGVIRRHANNMHRLTSAIPPRPSCVFPASAKKPLGAWFAANSSPGAARRDCINAPDVSLAFYMLYGPGGNKTATAKDMGVSETAVTYAKALRKGKVSVFPTKAECCMPALGAYPAGCTSRA